MNFKKYSVPTVLQQEAREAWEAITEYKTAGIRNHDTLGNFIEQHPDSETDGWRLLVVVDSYAIGELRVQRCMQGDLSYKWAVRHNGNVLSINGEWDYEPQPSSRTDEWLRQFRFDTAEQAIAAAVAAIGEEPQA